MDYKVHNGPGHTWQPDMTTWHDHPAPASTPQAEGGEKKSISTRLASVWVSAFLQTDLSFFISTLACVLCLPRQAYQVTASNPINHKLRLSQLVPQTLESLATFEALVSVTFSCLIFLRSQQHEMSVKPWKHKLNYFKTFIDCENIWLD